MIELFFLISSFFLIILRKCKKKSVNKFEQDSYSSKIMCFFNYYKNKLLNKFFPNESKNA